MVRKRSFPFIAAVCLSLIVVFLPITSWANAALAQSSSKLPAFDSTQSSAEIVDFLVKNAALDDFSVPLSTPELPFQPKPFNYELFSLNKFGKLVMQAKSELAPPKELRLSGNKISMAATASLQHEIEGEKLPPHFQISLQGKASDTDFLSNEQENLASAELTFEGLLLKGVPEFLSKTTVMKELTQPEPKGSGLKLETDPNNDSWAKISKTIQFTQGADLEKFRALEETLLAEQNEIQTVRARIAELEGALEQAHQSKESTADIQKLEETLGAVKSQMTPLQDSLKKDFEKKLQLLSSAFLSQEFRCAPEFFKEIKFPIWEKRSSQSTSSSGQSASAKAAVGVSGDVVIDISNPTCQVAIVPPFRGETSTFVDVSVTSSGYFGARADAQASKEIAVVFKNKKDGTEYHLSNPTLTREEKETLNRLVLKSVDDVKNSEAVTRALQARIDAEFVQPLVTSIETALIGPSTAPASPTQICSLLDQLGLKTPGSQEDLVCQAWQSSAAPIRPELKPPPVLSLPELTLPPPLGLVCLPEAPLPPCRVERRTVQPPDVPCPGTCERNVDYPCPTWRNPRRTCTKTVPYPCTKKCRPPTQTVEVEIPPGCRQAQQIAERSNGEIRLTCSRIRRWEEERNAIIRDWENRKAAVQTKYEQDFTEWQKNVKRPYDQKLEKWQEDLGRWERYRDPALIRNLATKMVRERILLSSVNSRAIAQKLLDFVWQVEEGARDVNDSLEFVNDFIQKYALDRGLSLRVKGSARAAFESKSYPLQTRPTVKFVSNLEFNSGEPSLKLIGSAYRDGPGRPEDEPGRPKGRVGGLSVLGLKFTVEQEAYLNDRKIGEVKNLEPWNPAFDPVGGERLSDKEEVFFKESVPLKIKAN